jgi:hypothetical protein
MSLMSAAHSGKFSKIDFKKTGFAAAGPEPSASEVEANLTLLCGSLPARGSLETPACLPTPLLSNYRGRGSHTERVPSHPHRIPTHHFAATGTERLAEAFWGPKGCAGPAGHTGCSGAKGPASALAYVPHHCPQAAKRIRKAVLDAVSLTRWFLLSKADQT